MKKAAPSIAIIGVVVVLIGVGTLIVLMRQKNPLPSLTNSPNPNQTPTLAANAQYESSEPGDYYYGPSPHSTLSSAPVSSPAPITDYIYQGSKVLTESSTKLEMESTGESEVITYWYKEKIRSLNFNAKSFTQINTNGVVFNKLSAVKPGEKIEVTIKKDQSTSNVSITVDRS